ncbi:MAG: hypothetical protein PVJ80_12880 [Gemmatimonadota bacterium]
MSEERDVTESADETPASGVAAGGDSGGPRGAAATRPVPLLPTRLLQAIVSPSKMAATVAEHPRWIGAMLVGAVLLSLSLALIPMEVMQEMQRRMMIQSGREVQEIPEAAQNIVRVVTIVAPAIAFIVMAFIGAGITTFIFAFVLGDEGTYRQYLAVGVHAAVIPTLASVLLAPMRVAAENPQLTINVGTFLPFLPNGYLANVFQAMDVTQIWAALVTALGIHAIDRRRSFGSAAAIQLGIVVVVALVAGYFLTRQGL